MRMQTLASLLGIVFAPDAVLMGRITSPIGREGVSARTRVSLTRTGTCRERDGGSHKSSGSACNVVAISMIAAHPLRELIRESTVMTAGFANGLALPQSHIAHAKPVGAVRGSRHARGKGGRAAVRDASLLHERDGRLLHLDGVGTTRRQVSIVCPNVIKE